MPQMMPMYWMLIFIFMVAIFLIVLNLIYFFIILYPTDPKYDPSKLYKNWKWQW